MMNIMMSPRSGLLKNARNMNNEVLHVCLNPAACPSSRPKLSLSLYQSQCPHIALINSQLQNNFTNLGPLKKQSKWFKCYLEKLETG